MGVEASFGLADPPASMTEPMRAGGRACWSIYAAGRRSIKKISAVPVVLDGIKERCGDREEPVGGRSGVSLRDPELRKVFRRSAGGMAAAATAGRDELTLELLPRPLA
jgi:hypothetical protein